MIAHHIHDALAQVRALQELIIEKNLFKGYSGRARLVAGLAAFAGAVVLASPWIPTSPWAHLAGWGTVLAVSLVANYGALVYWFLCDDTVGRNPLMIKPALDAIPALAAGAVLSLALIQRHAFDLLPGVWMALYGLAQVAYRSSLPKGVYRIGLFYLCCGAVCLLGPWVTFTNPWPMGWVFLAGETAGGVVLIRDHRRSLAKANTEEAS